MSEGSVYVGIQLTIIPCHPLHHTFLHPQAQADEEQRQNAEYYAWAQVHAFARRWVDEVGGDAGRWARLPLRKSIS